MSSAGVSVPKSRHLLFWAIALGGAAFDLWTKAAIFDWVGDPPFAPPRPILGRILEFKTNYNAGALWGLGRNVPHSALIFAALSIVAAVAIYFWLFVRKAAADWRLTAALGLIMAGAIGNCHDRLRFGHVRDFVHFHVDSIGFDFPIFNFADNMLVLGAVWLMIMALHPSAQPAPAPTDADPATTQAATPSTVGN